MILKLNPDNEDQYTLKNNKKFHVINCYELILDLNRYSYSHSIIIEEDDKLLVLEEYCFVPCEILTYRKGVSSFIKNYEIKNCTLYKVFCRDIIAVVSSENFIQL